MSKNILSFFMIGITALTTMSCQQDLMQYEGEDCLYFDVRRGAEWLKPSTWGHQYFSEVAFGSITNDDATLNIVVKTSGGVKDYDRKFKVVINTDSTTAVQGKDFDGLENEYNIKAGATSAIITLHAFRTVAMHGDTLHLQLKLLPNEHFNLKYQQYHDYPGTYKAEINPAFNVNKDAAIHNIYFHDVLVRPESWMGNNQTGTGLFGKFTEKKYRLMMQITQTTIHDYTKKKMPVARAKAISQKMSAYLLENAKQKHPILEDDGTMMYFMEIENIGGSAAWKPFTLPKDYYKTDSAK